MKPPDRHYYILKMTGTLSQFFVDCPAPLGSLGLEVTKTFHGLLEGPQPQQGFVFVSFIITVKLLF